MVISQLSRAEKLKIFWDSFIRVDSQSSSADSNLSMGVDDPEIIKSFLANEQQRIRSFIRRRVRLAKRVFKFFALHHFLHEIHAFVETDPDVLLSYLLYQAEMFLRQSTDGDQIMIPSEIVALVEELQSRLRVKWHRFHQQPCYPATTIKRAALVAQYLRPGSRGLCMGDDDFVSIALAMMTGNEITVIDLDPQVISLIQETANNRKLRIATQIVNIYKRLPSSLIAAFDVIITDPIYFVKDMMNFLSAAEQCLSTSAGSTLLTCCARALAGPAWNTVQRWAASRGLVAEKFFDGFNEYPKPVHIQALLSMGERLFCHTPMTQACARIPDVYSDIVVFRRIARGGWL